MTHRMALLTNDYKLGKDISDLNNLASCYGKKVAVFCLTRTGDLEERLYEEEPAPAEPVKQDVPEVKSGTKDELDASYFIIRCMLCSRSFHR